MAMATDVRTDYEAGNKVSDEPLVVVIEDYIHGKEADHLVAAAQSQLKRACVSAGAKGIESDGRTGRNCWVNHYHDDVIGGMCQRIADMIAIPLDFAEYLQVIHYGESQEYAPHFDAWEADTERGQLCMARGGQRLVTCLIYLNTVQSGGGTCFPKLDLEVRAIKGRMVVFHNCHPGTNLRHPASLHGGLPVLAGEKWACNLWFRESSYNRSTKPLPKAKRRYSRVV